MLTRDHIVLPAIRMFSHEWNEPYLSSPQLQSVTTFWLVLISCPAEGRRLSRSCWLGDILEWFTRLKTVTRPSTNRDGRESNS